jgi:hypothetical protein
MEFPIAPNHEMDFEREEWGVGPNTKRTRHSRRWSATSIAEKILAEGKMVPTKEHMDDYDPTTQDLAFAVSKASEAIVDRCDTMIEEGPAPLKERAKVVKADWEPRLEFEDEYAEDETISEGQLMDIYLKCMAAAKESWNWEEARRKRDRASTPSR